MNTLMHIFRIVLLIALGVVFLFFTEIDHKLELMTGWIIGTVLAYTIGFAILQRRKRNRL